MTTIMISDISKEAASKAKGILLKEQLKNLIEQRENDICVDFSGISRFASPFFNNSFAALALIYGFSTISSIKISNLSEVCRDTYQTSMANAKAVSQNQTHINEINQIIDNAPKKVLP